MNSQRKSILLMCAVTLLCASGITTVSYGKLSPRHVYPYSNIGSTYRAITSEELSKNGAMYINNSLSKGNAGAKIWVAASNGSDYYATFPYHVSRSDMKVPMKKNVTYTAHIAAVSDPITGKVSEQTEY